MLSRVLPPDANPLARPGASANLALLVAVVTGVALLIWYSPSVHTAYSSLDALRGVTPGGWVRALHRYSSDLAMLLLLVHAGRTFVARKFAGARWLAWVSGVAMIGLVWFIGWTGYWLVWDQPAQQIAVSSMRLLDALPVFGEPLGRLYLADRLVPSLLFFVVFFLHMLLPLGIAVGLALHLARVSRAKLLPGRGLTIALVAGLAVAALLVPAPLDDPAQMAVKAPGFTVDAWYLAPLALGLRFQSAGLWVALLGTSVFAASLPWLLGRRPVLAKAAVGAKTRTQGPALQVSRSGTPRFPFQAEVEQSRCHACNQCVQDCPFEAISMVPRTDGKPFASQAFVDPSRCVGCGVCAGSCDSEGIGVPWFDTRREEARLEREIAENLAAGAPAWTALICGDIDGGLARFNHDAWQQRLPGYQVHAVPTSSWVQPKFVERLSRHGIPGVLIVRDARFEAAARDGGRWVAERLLQQREPKFQPKKSGENGGRWRVVDFDPSAPHALTCEAEMFQRTGASGVSTRKPTHLAITLGGISLALVLGAATLGPSMLRVSNPAPMNPEFVFSFKAVGEWIETAPYDPAQDADKPIHMRGRSTDKPHRAPVHVRITIDGIVAERVFAGKGISSDGPAIGEWRIPLTTGDHDVAVSIITGNSTAARQWQGTIHAKPRRLHVVTFDPGTGFTHE